MLRRAIVVLAPSLLLGLAACAQNPDEPDEKVAEEVKRDQPVKIREHSDLTVAPGDAKGGKALPASDVMSRMAQDLAQRLGVRPAQLQVLAVDSVVFNDGALGCPQPGQSYVQALQPGSRVLFSYDGKTYQYHASERGHFIYCANPSEPAGKFDRE